MDKPTVADLMSDLDKCYICLSPFEKQAVASVENCQHVFCLECILQWSQIRVKTPKKDDDEEEEEEGSSAVICEECGRSDRRHRLLVCTRCDSGHHMDCLTPPLNTGPEGDWVCPECAIIPQQTDSFVLEEEISDGELTDLLAEVDETASTSSRLRPSTMSRPGRSTERRHSQRIQSRASGDPDPRPPTSWHVPKYLLRASKPAVASGEAAAHPHHSDTSSASVRLKTRKRRKRAT
ncbi:PHD and RING finger domain-containing protein 1-like isoform X3 [Acanthopagrus latus]|uniref:PHD and RING finger domain-containing protein 1-like isoform X3 n=1 Tax=Acanthopagrus latus TaxID=8177 RepID=UPI00187D0913|nr:PHD and RING finger domain-containing protein 1-like isoform X3 [Acanthopagrus latus]